MQVQALDTSQTDNMGQSTRSLSAAQGSIQPSNGAVSDEASDEACSSAQSDATQEKSHTGSSSSGDESARWIFSSQQMRLSVAQMDVYIMSSSCRGCAHA